MTPKNIVICFDGTSNQFGPNNTNVIRLVQVVDRDKQRLYYDPGVGTLPELGWASWIGQKWSLIKGLAFGAGLNDKVEAAYTFLMNYWEPETKVYIFGFSRGAYTARVLAGMLHSLGLLSRGNHDLVPYVMRLFKSLRGGQPETGDNNYWKLCNGFRWTFAREVGNDQRHFPIHFLGLWDTVSSVGWVWEPASFPYTAANPSVTIARHAVSIDEHRAFFRSNLLKPTAGQDWEERWFPGVHADIGGGYPEADGGLWRPPFDWMRIEAQRAGLLVDDSRLPRVLNRQPPPRDAWNEPIHESLHGLWHLAEYFPKQCWTKERGQRYVPNRYQSRFIPDGALIDRSALQRVRAGNYQPRNFSAEFVREVQGLAQAPDMMPFKYA